MTDSNEFVGEKTSAIQPDQNHIYDFQWPLQWLFGSHKEKLDAIDLNSDNDNFLNSDNDFDEPIKKLNWRNLYYMPGWESSHWLQIEENIPADPGIYVIVHEAEKATLYVGQAQNLRKRVLSPRHHKIPKILEMYRAEGTYSHRRDFPLHHDTNCVDYDVIIFWHWFVKVGELQSPWN